MAEIVLLGEVQDLGALPVFRRPKANAKVIRPLGRGGRWGQLTNLRELGGLAGATPKLPKLMKAPAPPPSLSAGDLQLGAQLAAEMAQAQRGNAMPVFSDLPGSLPQAGLMDRVSGGIQKGTTWVERLGGQVVGALNAATRLKQATAMQRYQVGQAWDRYQGVSWFDLELIPGVKNLYLALGAGGLLALLLMNRGK